MPQGWERLARAIVAERSRRWRTRKEFARAARVSVRVIGDLERGRRANYLDSTLSAVEGSLGWAPGSCERIVAGGKPAREMDPLLSRLLDTWPQLPPEARAMLVELAERALR